MSHHTAQKQTGITEQSTALVEGETSGYVYRSNHFGV